jgi:hypothetical protein
MEAGLERAELIDSVLAVELPTQLDAVTEIFPEMKPLEI